MHGLRGAKVLFVPLRLQHDHTVPAHWELLLRQRAVDNQCFTVGVYPRPGTSMPPTWPTAIPWSASDPWGTVLCRQRRQTRQFCMLSWISAVWNPLRRQLPISLARARIFMRCGSDERRPFERSAFSEAVPPSEPAVTLLPSSTPQSGKSPPAKPPHTAKLPVWPGCPAAPACGLCPGSLRDGTVPCHRWWTVWAHPSPALISLAPGTQRALLGSRGRHLSACDGTVNSLGAIRMGRFLG